jgi:hypothetical protein
LRAPIPRITFNTTIKQSHNAVGVRGGSRFMRDHNNGDSALLV